MSLSAKRNYLRACGEYLRIAEITLPSWELPPRARRIPPNDKDPYHAVGTTSACAENTVYDEAYNLTDGNYLRVRGEYTVKIPISVKPKELPPRARRIHCENSHQCQAQGTTSACAENTLYHRRSRRPHWNYLRVRGEYAAAEGGGDAGGELPPRARRIHPQPITAGRS